MSFTTPGRRATQSEAERQAIAAYLAIKAPSPCPTRIAAHGWFPGAPLQEAEPVAKGSIRDGIHALHESHKAKRSLRDGMAAAREAEGARRKREAEANRAIRLRAFELNPTREGIAAMAKAAGISPEMMRRKLREDGATLPQPVFMAPAEAKDRKNARRAAARAAARATSVVTDNTARDAAIVAAYTADPTATPHHVGKPYKIQDRQVRRILAAAGVVLRETTIKYKPTPPPPSEMDVAIAEMYRTGKGYRLISKETGMSQSTVKRALRRCKVPARKQGARL